MGNSTSPESGSDGLPAEPSDVLAPHGAEPTADVLEPYPRAEYDAMVDGHLPVGDYVDGLIRHAEAQLPMPYQPGSRTPTRRRRFTRRPPRLA